MRYVEASAAGLVWGLARTGRAKLPYGGLVTQNRHLEEEQTTSVAVGHLWVRCLAGRPRLMAGKRLWLPLWSK
jgi:hypothetical protein